MNRKIIAYMLVGMAAGTVVASLLKKAMVKQKLKPLVTGDSGARNCLQKRSSVVEKNAVQRALTGSKHL